MCGERAVAVGAGDVQDTERLVAREDRHAHGGLDVLARGDEVEARVLRDIGDEDGLAVLGHPARHPFAHRDGGGLDHIGGEPVAHGDAKGSGAGIEQHDRAGVGLGHLNDLLEGEAEELVDVERGNDGAGDFVQRG